MKIVVVTAVLALGLLSGCATAPPKSSDNICNVFDEKRGWYKDARRSERRWGSDIATLMAIMYQESSFRPKAKPPRTKILWIIPGPRPSSAYGYAQVKDETWNEYQRLSGNHWASRTRFADAIDFIGYYNTQSNERLGIGKNDARNLYLAYHEGHGGYQRRTYNQKAWLVGVANKVGSRAKRYREQLDGCERRFKGPWWWPLR
ncbi:transglycosylase SLT domain-containing protein [Marinimicrobium sp. ARAG 43.8]|uniref:transglycosylase SLT domain-containing protein n=1 Tax=Marinimicrobium sp. ARAG 43.8 TaxID=3418719 RepID=UPI003CF3B926